MDPTVCSTTSAASPYDFWPSPEILECILETIPPAATNKGTVESMTSVRSQPFTKATVSPPKKVVTSCANFPT